MARTCEENLARRSWSSARFRQRQPAEQLRTLLAYPLPEPVWARLAKTALASGSVEPLKEAIRQLQQRIAQREKSRRHLVKTQPLHYENAA